MDEDFYFTVLVNKILLPMLTLCTCKAVCRITAEDTFDGL